MKEVKMRIGRMGVRFFFGWGEEVRLPVSLYEDDLILFDESKENLKEMMGSFSRILKVSRNKSKEMVFLEEDASLCEVLVDGMRFECVSEFKYLGVCFG